jgi:hypothetical protein
MRKSIALAIAAVFVSGGLALAAQQGAAAKKLLLNNPPSGNKKIVYLSKNTSADVEGNPVTDGGASFFVSIGNDGSQCISLPASNWEATPVGFKYKDPQLANGPVKVALIKKTPSGNFLLKVVAKGSGITVVPGAPTSSYNTNFKINGGGDEYCSSDGSAAPTKDTDKKFLVKNDDGTTCAAACSSPSGAFLEAALAF